MKSKIISCISVIAIIVTTLQISISTIAVEISNVTEEKNNIEYNTNYSPEFYGTTNITIRVGDVLDLKSSYYRILAKDFEDGNITKSIEVISNNVDTANIGIYNISYRVVDSNGNETKIDVPVNVIQNGDRKIQRTLYVNSGLEEMKESGFNRGNNHDRQNLGIYLPSETSVIAKQVNGSKDLEVEFLNNDVLKESRGRTAGLGCSTESDEIEIFNNNNVSVGHTSKKILASGEDVTLNNNVKVTYRSKQGSQVTVWDKYSKSFSSVPFIETPENLETNPIIEITLNDDVKPLKYYTYGDSMTEFKNKWEISKDDFAVLEGSRCTFLVPYKDLADLGVSKSANPEYVNDTFNSIDDILTYYDEVIEDFDEFIGLSYNAQKETDKNVKTKYFFKADIHNNSYAYYGRYVAMVSDSLDEFLHNKSNGWCALHEIAHGYQGDLKSEGLDISEVSNNILAYYYQKENLQGTWLGEIPNIEKEIMQSVRTNEVSYLVSKYNNTNKNVATTDLNLPCADLAQIRLYAYINLLNKFEPKDVVSNLYSYYRELANSGSVKSTDGIFEGADIIAESIGNSYGYNVIPYFKEWKVDFIVENENSIYSKDYPMLYFLRDLVKNDEQAEIIKNDLNLEGIYSLVSNKDIEKYNFKGNACINIDDAFYSKIQGKTIVLKSGTEIICKSIINSKNIEFYNIPVGIYEIELLDIDYISSQRYICIQQENTIYNNLSEKEFTEIEIVREPTKTKYTLGEELDLSGGRIKVKYSDNTVDFVELTDETIEIEGYDKYSDCAQLLKLKYKGRETTLPILVIENSEKYNYIELPNKVQYKIGEELDLTGGSLSITTNSGWRYTYDLTMNSIQVTGFDNLKPGKQILTVTYNSETAKFMVEVLDELETFSINSFTGIQKYNKGDVNGDGVIDMRDTSEALLAYNRKSVGIADEDTNRILEIADINLDGKTDFREIISISSYYASKSAALNLTELLKYDFNDDSVIDNKDYELLKNMKQNGYDAKYDLNSDGKITDDDLSCFIKFVKNSNK